MTPQIPSRFTAAKRHITAVAYVPVAAAFVPGVRSARPAWALCAPPAGQTYTSSPEVQRIRMWCCGPRNTNICPTGARTTVIILSYLGKPSFKKKSILQKSFVKRWPPSPVGVLWKLIFFLDYILGHLHCIVKKIEVWNPNDPLPPFVKLFRKIDFFKKDGFPYFGLILTFFSTPVLMAFWQCTWPDSSQEIQLPSDQSGVKLTWWMQERDHKRSMKKYVGHTVVNLERTYISYMKYI